MNGYHVKKMLLRIAQILNVKVLIGINHEKIR